MRKLALLLPIFLVFIFAPGARAQCPTQTPNIGMQIPNIGNTTTWGICLNGDLATLDNLLGGTHALPTATTTPLVSQYANYVTANTGSYAITNFVGGYPGQTIRLFCGTGDTYTSLVNGTNILLSGSWSCVAGNNITLTLIGSVWTEVDRYGASNIDCSNPFATGSLAMQVGVNLLGCPALSYLSWSSSTKTLSVNVASSAASSGRTLILNNQNAPGFYQVWMGWPTDSSFQLTDDSNNYVRLNSSTGISINALGGANSITLGCSGNTATCITGAGGATFQVGDTGNSIYPSLNFKGLISGSNILSALDVAGSNVGFCLPSVQPSTAVSVLVGTPNSASPSCLEATGTAMSWLSTQGTDTKILTSGTISGTSATLCTDANGGATTSGCPSGSGITLQTNTVNNSNQTALNLLNSSAFNGLTATVTNTGGGNVQLGFSGTLGNSGLTNSAITIAGTSVSLGGSTSSFPSPGAIGGTTPAAGTFTTLTANTNLVINGGTALTTTNQSGTGSLCMTNSCAMTTPSLGTPSALTLTNATGLPNAGLVHSSITIAGTSVSLGNSTSSFPSPGAIGGTTPAAGTFTTLTANTSLVINGGTAQTGTQGTDTNLLTAGTISGTAATLCTDANGGATTSGCSSGSSGISNQVAKGISSNTSGTSTLVDSVVCTPPTTNGVYQVGYSVTASAAVAPACPQAGISNASISGATSTYTVGASSIDDAIGFPIVHDIAGSSAVSVTLPTPTTLTNTNAVVIYENRSAQTDTITPTTWTIQSNVTAAASSLSVPPATRVVITVDPHNSTNWLASTFLLTATVSSIATAAPLGGGTINTSGTLTCNTCVVASSPGAGIAHFAGSTQTVTSSLIVAADITNNTITGTQLASSLVLVTPQLGAATGLTSLATTTNCAAAGTAANPSVASCTAAPSGSFSCATNASTGTCTVNTTVVTANSNIFVQPVAATVIGTKLGVTCNTTADTGLLAPRLAAQVAATGFTINLGTFATNPLCFNYWIVD